MNSEERVDQFSSALQLLLNVHQTQIQTLSEQLEGEQRARKELKQQVEALKKTNDDASKVVEQAKKKIKQQAKIIQELKKKTQLSQQEESTAAFESEPSIPVEVESPGHSSAAANGSTHKLNQTCATLFESPAVETTEKSKVISPATPGRPDLVKTKTLALTDETGSRTTSEERGLAEEEAQVDYHRGESVESVETVADLDVIVVDDNVSGNSKDKDHTHSTSKSDVNQSLKGKTRCNKVEQTNLPPSGPIHVFYSHTHKYNSLPRPLEERNERSPNMRRLPTTNTTGRPLSLRDSGPSKVKWKETSSSLASTSSSSGSPSETRLSLSPDKTVSPHHDSNSTSTSSSPEQSSPSLLGSSSSPWKVQHSSSSTPSSRQPFSTPVTSVNVSQSLFPKTPASVSLGAGSVVLTTPVSMLKAAIPQSDSQLSFDVSQSAPLSPELCPSTNQLHNHPITKQKKITNVSSVKQTSKFTDSSPHSVDQNVVPITPGVPSVNKILGGKKRFMTAHDSMGSLATSTITAGKVLSLGSIKRRQDQVDSDNEDILPKSKVRRPSSIQDDAAACVDDDQTRIDEVEEMEPVEDEEEIADALSPVMLYPTRSTASAAARGNSKPVSGEARGRPAAGNKSSPGVHQHQLRQDQQTRLLKKAGLPTNYKCEAVVRRRADRDKLDGKACPDCKAWFSKDDGIHVDIEQHLRGTCRHKYVHAPPDEDSRLWDISFPATEECNDIMDKK